MVGNGRANGLLPPIVTRIGPTKDIGRGEVAKLSLTELRHCARCRCMQSWPGWH
jgi:hypothetical protein